MPAHDVKVKAIFERKHSGGGSGGGSGSSHKKEPSKSQTTDAKTEVTQKPDGSVITTTKNEDGSVTIKTETKEGVTSTTTVDKAGESKTEITIPDAQKQTVTLPIAPVVAGDKHTIHLDIQNRTDVVCHIPTEQQTPSMVVMVTKPDGTKEVLRKSVVHENGITFLANKDMTVEIIDNQKTFADVSGHWAKDAIDFVTSHELYYGTKQNLFSPNATMTRAMLVQVLHNLEHNPKVENTVVFSDIPSGVWFADAVQWAVANHVASGENATTFAPQKDITREDLAVILYRYAGSPHIDETVLTYQDAPQISPYAKDAIAWATKQGILYGTKDAKYNPKTPATRAEVASVLMRFLEQSI